MVGIICERGIGTAVDLSEGRIWCKQTLSPFEVTLINKTYTLALQGGTSFQYAGSVCTTAFVPTKNNTFVLHIRQVIFPLVNIFGSNLNFRCGIVDTDNSIVV